MLVSAGGPQGSARLWALGPPVFITVSALASSAPWSCGRPTPYCHLPCVGVAGSPGCNLSSSAGVKRSLGSWKLHFRFSRRFPIINDHCSFLLGHKKKSGSTHNWKSGRSRFPEYEMSASSGNDIHPETLKIAVKTEASRLGRLEEQGELGAEARLADYVWATRQGAGFTLVFFLRDTKSKLEKVGPEGLCPGKYDLATRKSHTETKPMVRSEAGWAQARRASLPLGPGGPRGSVLLPGTSDWPLEAPRGQHRPRGLLR